MPDERPLAEDLVSFLADPNGLRLKEPLEAEKAAKQILALYERSGREGATFNLRFGDMSGRPLYSVSLWPERGTQPSDNEISVRLIQDFIEANSDVLKDLNDPRCGIGLWYDASENVVYLDIVALLPDRLEAIRLAELYDQIAIFDLTALTDVETGGTGNSPADMPPVTKRLPSVNSKADEEF